MNKTVFLTGGAGVLGQALLAQLTDSPVICLVHHTPIKRHNVVSICGDITQPQLGLADAQFADLAARVDWIVHSAAITDFSRPSQQITAVNVHGTENVLHLAAMANVPFYQISTAFTHGDGHHEEFSDLNTYESSKLTAEQAVRESGLPTVILRPSIIIGDSQSGMISDFQGIHLLMSLFFKGLLPVLPGGLQCYVDIVPQDIIAKTIVALIQQEIVNQEYWLTAGENTLRVHDIITLCAEYSEELTGRTIHVPRVVSPEMFERLIRPVFLPALPLRHQRIFERALQLTKYFNMAEPFPTSLTNLLHELNLPPFPDLRQVFIQNMRYLAKMSQFDRQRTGEQTNHHQAQKEEVKAQ